VSDSTRHIVQVTKCRNLTGSLEAPNANLPVQLVLPGVHAPHTVAVFKGISAMGWSGSPENHGMS